MGKLSTPINVKATVVRSYNKKTKNCTHIFSVFECLEGDMGGYPSNSYYFVRADGPDAGDERIFLTISDLLLTDAFLQDPLNHFEIPDKNGNLDKFSFKNSAFTAIPSIDNEYLLMDETHYSELKNILPNSDSPTWIKSYVDNQHSTLEYLKKNPKLLTQLENISKAELGFNLLDCPENIGNIFIVWHHKDIRSIRIKGASSPSPGIILGLSFRNNNRPPLKVNICLIENQDCVAEEITFCLQDSGFTQLLPLSCKPKEIIIKIYDDDGDLIYYHTGHFSEIIEFAVSMPSAVIDGVEYEDSEGNIHLSGKVQKWVREYSSIGEITDAHHVYFSDSVKYRNYKKLRAAGSFVFFDGERTHKNENKEEARRIVCSLLNRARTRCYICDDYFSASDFANYVMPLQHNDIHIRILSSLGDKGRDEAVRLAQVSDNYNKRIGRKMTECKMLRGKKSVLHDRFIIVDDDIWAVGASFNELGARASLIYKIPTEVGHIIIKEIENWWNDPSITVDVHSIQSSSKCIFKKN